MITTLDQLIAAQTQRLTYVKTGTRTVVSAVHFSGFDLAGNPSGALAVGNTTTGIVPTDAIAGYPSISAFPAGADVKGYLAGVQFSCGIACRLTLFDTLFSAGNFPFNANVTLSGQPDYLSRVPNGDVRNNTEIWLECVNVFTGNQTITITYTNQDGVSGRTTGTIATGITPIAGRMLMLPLQLGDTGVQKIESVVSTVSTAGTFNVHVLRRLWSGRVRVNNDGDAHDFTKTGMPEIYADSALRVTFASDSSGTAGHELQLEIAAG